MELKNIAMHTYLSPVNTNGIKSGILKIAYIFTVKSLLADKMNLSIIESKILLP